MKITVTTNINKPKNIGDIESLLDTECAYLDKDGFKLITQCLLNNNADMISKILKIKYNQIWISLNPEKYKNEYAYIYRNYLTTRLKEIKTSGLNSHDGKRTEAGNIILKLIESCYNHKISNIDYAPIVKEYYTIIDNNFEFITKDLASYICTKTNHHVAFYKLLLKHKKIHYASGSRMNISDVFYFTKTEAIELLKNNVVELSTNKPFYLIGSPKNIADFEIFKLLLKQEEYAKTIFADDIISFTRHITKDKLDRFTKRDKNKVLINNTMMIIMLDFYYQGKNFKCRDGTILNYESFFIDGCEKIISIINNTYNVRGYRCVVPYPIDAFIKCYVLMSQFAKEIKTPYCGGKIYERKNILLEKYKKLLDLDNSGKSLYGKKCYCYITALDPKPKQIKLIADILNIITFGNFSKLYCICGMRSYGFDEEYEVQDTIAKYLKTFNKH